MNSRKLSSNKELTVRPPIKTSKLEAFTKHISTKLHAIFSKQSSSKELIVITTNPNILVENRMKPLENMMNQVANKVNQLSDEWVLTEAQRLFTQFWDWIKQNREIEFINSDIMALIWKGEQLPTIFFDNPKTIIEKFWIIIQERLNIIRQRKLAELMDSISKWVNQLPNNESTLKLAKELHEVFWKRKPWTEAKEEDYVNWDNEFRVEYINEQLLLRTGIKEQLPKILEKDADKIIKWFYHTVQQKASFILNKWSNKLIPE